AFVANQESSNLFSNVAQKYLGSRTKKILSPTLLDDVDVQDAPIPAAPCLQFLPSRQVPAEAFLQ
ncbi:UNVERIFIED_CONTAM: hypothetical protein NY603_31850, partial [Bacteroidetes bacterium 56_B9]